jgi:hypothetical protein
MALYWFIRHFSYEPKNAYPIDKPGNNLLPVRINYPHSGNLIPLKVETHLCYYWQASSAILNQKTKKLYPI